MEPWQSQRLGQGKVRGGVRGWVRLGSGQSKWLGLGKVWGGVRGWVRVKLMVELGVESGLRSG